MKLHARTVFHTLYLQKSTQQNSLVSRHLITKYERGSILGKVSNVPALLSLPECEEIGTRTLGQIARCRANQLTFRKNRSIPAARTSEYTYGEEPKGKEKEKVERRGTADVNERLLPLMDSPRDRRDLRG